MLKSRTPCIAAAFALFAAIPAIPAGAQGAKDVVSPALEQLHREARSDPASAPRMEAAKDGSARSFDGQSGQVADVRVLTPVEIIDVPGAKPVEPPPSQTPEAPPVKPPKDDDPPSYHFVGKTPINGLTIYTAERDVPGGKNENTRGSAPATLGTYAKWGALGLGLLSLIAGIFFQPMLFVGAALLGVGGGLWLGEKFK